MKTSSLTARDIHLSLKDVGIHVHSVLRDDENQGSKLVTCFIIDIVIDEHIELRSLIKMIEDRLSRFHMHTCRMKGKSNIMTVRMIERDEL